MIGKVYNIPPQPPMAEHTTWFDAGTLTIGVEYRDVDPDNLYETYKDNPEQLAEYLKLAPAGGFTDEGVSLHVRAVADNHEYLRFDVFDGEPHYHYVHRTGPEDEIVNNVLDYDVPAHGDMLDWAVRCLRERLPEMLTEAGGAHVVATIDNERLATVVDEVEQLSRKAQATQRAAAEGR
jgi:hypothetical protein